MISILGRLFASLRTWVGWNDPADNHPHQAHGWLLPDASNVAGAPAVAVRETAAASFEERRS